MGVIAPQETCQRSQAIAEIKDLLKIYRSMPPAKKAKTLVAIKLAKKATEATT